MTHLSSIVVGVPFDCVRAQVRHGGDGRLRRRELQAQPRRAHGLVPPSRVPSCTSSRMASCTPSRLRSPKIAAGRGCPPSARVFRAPTYLMIPPPVLPHIPRIQIQLAVPTHPHRRHLHYSKGTPGSMAPRPVIVRSSVSWCPIRSISLVLSVAVYRVFSSALSLLGLRSNVWISVGHKRSRIAIQMYILYMYITYQ